jgi:predicted nucleic acid-binding protein
VACQLERRIGRRLAGVIVLDASALISLASSKDAQHDWALKMFRDTAEFDLQMSSLTKAEVLVHPARAGQLEKFQKMLNALDLFIAPIESQDSASLAALRAKTSLKMPDIAVLHQALKAKGSIATTDEKLVTVAKKLGVGVFHPKG